MRRGLSCRAIFGALVALTVLWILPLAHGQEPPQQQPGEQGNSVSDEDLEAFVKVYVKIQEIRSEYEPALEGVQDPQEIDRVRQEIESRAKEVLQRQGGDAESYRRIFATINSDEDLRQKALALIERERRKPRSERG